MPTSAHRTRGTSGGGNALAICISLGTTSRATARFRAALLDAEFEKAVQTMKTGGSAANPAELRRALTAYRDQLLVVAVAANEARPPDPVVAPPGSVTIEAPQDLLARLIAFAENADATGCDLPVSLPANLAAEISNITGRVAAPRPAARFRGAAERRAQEALARASRCAIALAVNDLSVADARLDDI